MQKDYKLLTNNNSMAQFVQGKGNLLDQIHLYDPQLAGEFFRFDPSNEQQIEQAKEILEGFTGVTLDSIVQKYAERNIIRLGWVKEQKFHFGEQGTLNNLIDWAEKQNQHYICSTTVNFEKELIALKKSQNKQGSNQALLRSDATCEDNYNEVGIATFAGLFETLLVTPQNFHECIAAIKQPHDNAANAAINGTAPKYQFSDSGIIYNYANKRGIDIRNSKMNLILHKKYIGNEVLLAEHPHYEGTVRVEYQDHSGNWEGGWLGMAQIPGIESGLACEFKRLMKHLRETGIINPKYVYVAEAIGGNSRKIIQIRPYMIKQDITYPATFVMGFGEDLLGPVPNEGIEFELNEETGTYNGVHFAGDLTVLRGQNKKIPEDMRQNNDISIIVGEPHKRGLFLSHAGLLNLERTPIYDATQSTYDSYNELLAKKVKKIRYIQKHEQRIFEAA